MNKNNQDISKVNDRITMTISQEPTLTAPQKVKVASRDGKCLVFFKPGPTPRTETKQRNPIRIDLRHPQSLDHKHVLAVTCDKKARLQSKV